MPRSKQRNQTTGLTNTTKATRPKMKMRQMGQDSTVIDGRFAKSDLENIGTTPGLVAFNVDPTSFNGPISSIAKNYQEYIVHRYNMHYVPNVGTTTGGKVWAGYFDNPEIIYRFRSGAITTGNMRDLVKQSRTVECWPVWQEHTLTTPQRIRRKMFQVDTTEATSTEIVDRSVQGMWVVFSEGNTTEDLNLGVINLAVSVRLFGLQDFSSSGI